ncbi:MAG: hypothetical protein H6553_10450 [Chitinophagales bacterium]|nr:hypothetical protein [Chitinophagales bacterium]
MIQINHKNIVQFIVLSILILLCIDLSAQQATATIANKKDILIGDWVPVDISVSAPNNAKVYFPNFNQKDSSVNSAIEVVNVSPVDTIRNGNINQYHLLVNFIVFDTGNILFNPFPVLVDNLGKKDTIYTEANMIHVAGVKIDTSKDIKPIKEPLNVPYTFKELLPYIGIVLLLVAIILAILLFIKWRKKKKEPIDERYLLPSHEWALKELYKLKQQKLWQKGNIKEYYVQLSDILRNYIELRFNIPALENTTDELMRAMHKGIIHKKQKENINQFLMLSDFVKFAKANPDVIDNENAIQTVESFIQETKKVEEPNPTNNSTAKKKK